MLYWYSAMVVSLGFAQVRVARPFPANTAKSLMVFGTAAGMAALLSDGPLVPARFSTRTWKVYSVPLVSPVTTW